MWYLWNIVIPKKEEENYLFTTSSVATLFELYRPIIVLLLERIEPRSTLTYEIIVSDLEEELRKALQLYKDNEQYLKDFRFSSYYFSYFKEYVNQQIDRGLLRIK